MLEPLDVGDDQFHVMGITRLQPCQSNTDLYGDVCMVGTNHTVRHAVQLPDTILGNSYLLWNDQGNTALLGHGPVLSATKDQLVNAAVAHGSMNEGSQAG